MAVQRDKVVKQEGNENPVGLETDNDSKGGRDNYERMQVLKTMTATRCRCNADDAMMKCNKQINTHNDNEKYGSCLERRSRGVTTLHHYKRISSRDLGSHQ